MSDSVSAASGSQGVETPPTRVVGYTCVACGARFRWCRCCPVAAARMCGGDKRRIVLTRPSCLAYILFAPRLPLGSVLGCLCYLPRRPAVAIYRCPTGTLCRPSVLSSSRWFRLVDPPMPARPVARPCDLADCTAPASRPTAPQRASALHADTLTTRATPRPASLPLQFPRAQSPPHLQADTVSRHIALFIRPQRYRHQLDIRHPPPGQLFLLCRPSSLQPHKVSKPSALPSGLGDTDTGSKQAAFPSGIGDLTVLLAHLAPGFPISSPRPVRRRCPPLPDSGSSPAHSHLAIRRRRARCEFTSLRSLRPSTSPARHRCCLGVCLSACLTRPTGLQPLVTAGGLVSSLPEGGLCRW